MRRREVFAFLALVSSAAIGACSLFVDTSGLSGNAAETAAETGTAPESGATDGPAIEGAAADAANDSAAFACDGGTTITSFDGFDTSGTVTIQDSTLTASATSTAKDENIEAVGRRNFPSAPSRVALSYDLVLTRNDIMYFEPGCGVNLADSQGGSIFRQTLAANHEAFSQYLNVDLPDGGSAPTSLVSTRACRSSSRIT